MARPRRKITARPRARWLAWSRNCDEVFDRFAAGWDPPHQVKVQRTARGSTWTAAFTTDQGQPATVVVRLRHGWNPLTEAEVISSTVKFSWRISGADLRAVHQPDIEATQ